MGFETCQQILKKKNDISIDFIRRNSMGEDLDPLSLRELQHLEQQLDIGLKRIRTRKVIA